MKKKTNILLALLLVIGLLFTACEPVDGDQPITSTKNGIESKYARTGPDRTTTTIGTGVTIYYPRGLEEGDYPVIVWGNGTGTPTMAYGPLLSHLASWGFIVVASNNSYDFTGSGTSLIKAIDYIIEQNKTPDSIFYGKVDTDRIGLTGHSMGGGAAITAATDDRVSCVAPLSPGPYVTTFAAVTRVKCPILFFSGSGMDFTATTYSMYKSAIKGGFNGDPVPAMFAQNKFMNHISFAWYGGGARGYLTAWFMYQLQDDPVAAQAFIDGCEICNNENWVKVESNLDSF